MQNHNGPLTNLIKISSFISQSKKEKKLKYKSEKSEKGGGGAQLNSNLYCYLPVIYTHILDGVRQNPFVALFLYSYFRH